MAREMRLQNFLTLSMLETSGRNRKEVPFMSVQGGWGGWPTGNGKKLSNSEAKPGPAVPGSCLASFHFLWAIRPIQGGPSGRGAMFVDIKFKVPSQYKLLKRNSQFEINKRLSARRIRQSRTWHLQLCFLGLLSISWQCQVPKCS